MKQSLDTRTKLLTQNPVSLMFELSIPEMCIRDSNIAAAFGMSNPAASHHLRILKNSGLITSRRSGKEVYYTLADTPEARLLHKAVDSLFHITCPKE